MALSIAVNLSGSPIETDVRAAQLIVGRENERRASDVDENGDPKLPPLPEKPLGQLATSYETLLAATLTKAHESYVAQANEDYVTKKDRIEAFKAASDSVRSQIDTLLGL